jgi:hypothetical protein
MSKAKGLKVYGVIAGLLAGVALLAGPAAAAELPPPEFEPTLSLRGDCEAEAIDPVPDPSCAGEPLAYPPPPGGPSGRFDESRAIAIDPYGNEYVASWADSQPNGRIDVFDDEGKFITEIAAASAKSIAVDSKGSLYVFRDNGDLVRYPPAAPYEPEAGNIKYTAAPVPVSSGNFVGAVAVDPSNDQLFVARLGVITEYASAEAGNGVITTIEPGLGPWSEAIAVDGQRRRIFVSRCKTGPQECGIAVLDADAPHALLDEVEGPNPPTVKFQSLSGKLSVGIDEETGHLFVDDIIATKKVYEFDEDYEFVSTLGFSQFQATASVQIAVSNGERDGGDAFNRHFLFVPVLSPAGRALAFIRGAEPPSVDAIEATNIGETEAELRATIDPNGKATEYTFEYEAEGSGEAALAGQGTIPGGGLPVEVGVPVSGLAPGGTYRFRVLAENELGAAEPLLEAVFATYDDAPITGVCANQGLRLGSSAALPDCRAYELVTPPDTNGRAPTGVGLAGDRFPTIEVSPQGEAASFSIEGGSLPGSNGSGSFRGDLYLAQRGQGGWTSALAGPSGVESTVTASGSTSPDQGYSFWAARGEGPSVIEGRETRYVRYSDGHSELIGRGSLGTDPRAEGKLITQAASHIVFETVNDPEQAIQLEEEAPPTGTEAVYDRTPDEVTHVVSLLPGDVTPAPGQNAAYVGASPDGEGIAFSIGTTLYLRVGNETSYEIGTGVKFAGVSEGGERIFYVEDGDLLAFDTSSEEVIEFSTAGEVTPVNVASEGARAYFVSEKVFGGANPQEEFAQAGEQNLYLSEEGAISFVGTVTDRDVDGEVPPSEVQAIDGLGLWTQALALGQPSRDPSRLTPDGSVLLFQSRAELDGYDPEGFAQVYRYDSVAGRLNCLSCNPTLAPASTAASLVSVSTGEFDPEPFSSSGFVQNLTPDGKRAFFESDEALVSTDTDGVKDVYEWEAQGVGSCSRLSGCVYLISSGRSQRDNFLYGQSEDGEDVFFTTDDVLSGQDGGATNSIYDARVGGGFPEVSSTPCEGEGCRPLLSPPPGIPAPESGARSQSGNVRPNKPKTCPKGKRKVKKNGKVRCVKKKQQKKAKKGKAGTSRGAGK